MPELHWRYGYGYCYALFVGVVVLALLLMWYNGLIKVGGVSLGVCRQRECLAVPQCAGWKRGVWVGRGLQAVEESTASTGSLM
jgi:hypothetical protein